MKVEAFYCYQDEDYATVLVVDHDNCRVTKVKNVSPDECEDNEFIYISEETASFILGGSLKSYSIEEIVYGEKPKHNEDRIMLFQSKINEKFSNPEYMAIINKEYELLDDMHKKLVTYFDIEDQSIEILKKINLDKFHELIISMGASEDSTDIERLEIISNLKLNEKSTGYYDIKLELEKDPNYIKFQEINKHMSDAFFDYARASVEASDYFEKEYSLFTDEYKQKIKEYAEKGMFLYCLNTPDWPIDDDYFTVDDVYDYLLYNNGLYLYPVIQQYIEHEDLGGIYIREANDLKASFNLMNQGLYWAALRNLYALIEHHHKFCADTFNGYMEKKQKYKNGKQRSEYISVLFESFKTTYYEEAWFQIDQAIQEIYSGKSARFVSRNAIIHGDYENPNINPSSKDVVNIFLLYVSLRQMVDYLKNVEEIYKNCEIYMLGHLINTKNRL